MRGLSPDQQYQITDLFAVEMTGRGRDGRMQSTLRPTGEKPTFAVEMRQYGLDEMVKLTGDLWK